MKNDISKAIADIVSAYINDSNDMSLDLANAICDYVKIKASQMGVNAVVAVTNSGANPVAVQCMDDSYIASYDIALNKAFTVVSLKMSTSTLKPLAQPGGSLYGIQFTNNGRIIVFGGGEPLKVGEAIVGGLGVSGGSEEQDTLLGRFGKDYFENKM